MKNRLFKTLIINILIIFPLIVFLELYFSFKEYDGAVKHSLINCSSDCQKIKETYWKNYFQFLQYHYSYFSKGYDKNNELSSLSDGYFTLGVIRDIGGNKEKSNAIILAGCSFTHGSHLNDNETFSYFLSNYLNRSVYNWGICSGSPREMLYILQNKKLLSYLTENNPDIKYVIYTYLPDHLNRLLYDFYIVSPYYYPVNNYTMLKYKKRNPILNSLFFIKKIDNYVLSLKETGENKFINDKLWHEFLDFCEKRLDKIIADGR